MIRIFMLFLCGLQASLVFSQASLKDTVFLQDVRVEKKKRKIVSYDKSGGPAYNGLDWRARAMVCLLDDLPDGEFSQVKFYLNTGLPNLLKSKLKIDYKDVWLGIAAYEVDQHGKPGKPITENEIKFLVSADHRGSIKVDLSSLHLPSQKMYFGFTVLSEVSKTEQNMYIRFCEDENAQMYRRVYHKASDKEVWAPEGKQSFKLDMKILSY